jgi:hypothetical protein
LKINNGFHFVTTFNNLGLKYLSLCGQYLIDILYLYFPINGNFENNLFMPANLGTFYIHWILLNLVYYFALTCITIITVKYLFVKKIKIKKYNTKIKEKTDFQTEETTDIRTE